MSYSGGRAPFSPDPAVLQSEKERYMTRIQEKEQREFEQQRTIKILTNEVEELNLKLSFLSNELAKREDECSRQTSIIQKLTNQRDYLQEKVDHYEKHIAVSNNLDTALKNLGDSACVEENRELKIRLAAAEHEAENARQEIARLRAEFELKEAGYQVLKIGDMPQAQQREQVLSVSPAEPLNRSDHISEGERSRNPDADPEVERARPPEAPEPPPPPPAAEGEPPASKRSAMGHAEPPAILFELPSLKRFPVSRREAHVLGTYRVDGGFVPRFSPSLPHRPADIVAPLRDASNGLPAMPAVQADSAAAAGGAVAEQPDATAVTEARARVDTAVAALRQHLAATPQRPVGAGKDKIIAVVHAGLHLPKVSRSPLLSHPSPLSLSSAQA